MLSLSEVSKQFKVHRSTIYRAVDTGKLSRKSDGSFDLAEVIRYFGEPKPEKVAVPQQQEVATSQLSALEELERVRREFSEYKRQAQEREDWFKGQIDKMQNLLELKSHTVADATSQQQSCGTASDNGSASPETIDNKEPITNETLHATSHVHVSETLRNVADTTVEQPKKRHGLLGRVLRAVLSD